MYTPDTRLIDLTVSDLIEIIINVQKLTKPAPANIYNDDKYVYGVKGLAKLLGCSQRAAAKIKASGKIDDAITQEGRIIIVDAEKAIELLRKSK